jgi:hypothetical protein
MQIRIKDNPQMLAQYRIQAFLNLNFDSYRRILKIHVKRSAISPHFAALSFQSTRPGNLQFSQYLIVIAIIQ